MNNIALLHGDCLELMKDIAKNESVGDYYKTHAIKRLRREARDKK